MLSSYEIPQRFNPANGEKINDYVIERKLGEGTFGIVYKVKNVHNGQYYALKVLKLWTIAHDKDRANLKQRFSNEYETGRIKSQNLVHSLSYGTILGNPYIVMDFCTGGDLSGYIGKMSPSMINSISTDILLGLQDLHLAAKVHRDLKPENVLLDSQNRALLTDFGVSGDANRRLTESDWMNRAKAVFGTYAYISPEQFDRRFDATVLPTTDIFSFGVMFYHIITGDLPFGGLETDSDLADYIKNMKKGNWQRQTLSQLSHYDNNWERVIDGCLKPNYKERFKAAKDIIPLFGTVNSMPSSSIKSMTEGDVILRVMQGEGYGAVYNLSKLMQNECGIITLGRQDIGVVNHIQIMETQSCYVSRYHATIERHGKEKWCIRDGQWIKGYSAGELSAWMESTNGTFVNSTKVSQLGCDLHVNDIISVGDVKLKVEII